MAERFYLNLRLAPGPVVLEGAEAHHLATVRRLRPGAVVCLFNGNGLEYQAEVVSTGKKSVELRIVGQAAPSRELPNRLIVAAPLPKGDRSQFLIEKLTELGVTHYIPLQTERSVVIPRANHIEKLGRYVIEASKQCGRNVLMEVAELKRWDELITQATLPSTRFLADPGGHPFSGNLMRDTVIAVGPEGGFTVEESAQAIANDWRPVALGPRTLRIETAAILLAGLVAQLPSRTC